MDLRHIPAIDAHSHPFSAETADLSEDVLRDAISVSLRGRTSRANESMLLARFVVAELARLFDCEPTFAGVVAARNAVSRDDYPGYIARLFADAAIDTLLVDHGYPANPELPFEPFAALLPRRPVQGYRIERFFPYAGSFHGTGEPQPFEAVLEAFQAKLDEVAVRDGHRFYKSIMAYRTGLAIKPTDLAAAREAWVAHQAYGDPAEKVIRDYLFVVTAAKARQHGIPFQLHTGHTSHVNVWSNTNPILLTPILNSGLIDGARLVLVHGGYPYCTEGGYLTSVFPDVYLDLSLMIPWASAGIARRISETLESAPVTKVMYGSDGIACPEIHWVAAHAGRRALGQVLDGLIRDGFLTSSQAEDAAHAILQRNARELYGL
ncbi:MAG TPA: amidohydrolase family protein [Thermomicrobiaceae bacterium]|nr:amidohydrolase family protein [Thermomicrobiaceae bacterium]